MRVYNKKDFLDLPEGTIFCMGVKWAFDNLSIKGESWKESSDFFYTDLCWIESEGSHEHFDFLEDSLKNGISYGINKSTSRDGMFDDNDVFLVFEKEDLEYLIHICKIATDVSK